ncbi:MAG: peptidoglycan editing factor PgeF [Burkholderiaceae bacterium]
MKETRPEPATVERAPWHALAELVPDWSVPGVQAFVSGRRGGVSTGQWGLADGLPGGLNLGSRCGDDAQAVRENRRRLRAVLPAEPCWLRQVHGTAVHVVGATAAQDEPIADAAVTGRRGVVLTVLTADCLPVFFAETQGRAVGVAHAGWRGLAAGVLEATAQALREHVPAGAELQAWLGPAIGPTAFEVGDDVYRAFCEQDPASAAAFVPGVRPGKWLADLYRLARLRLGRAGVTSVSGGGHCTVGEDQRFYSFRRDAGSGRMASLIWLDP